MNGRAAWARLESRVPVQLEGAYAQVRLETSIPERKISARMQSPGGRESRSERARESLPAATLAHAPDFAPIAAKSCAE